MKALSFKTFSVLVAFALAYSCGKDEGSKKSASSRPVQEVVATDGSNIQGLYMASFKTLNSQVNGTLPGSMTFLRKEEKLFLYLRLFAGMPKAWHMQGVYSGSRCPTNKDDTNDDGFIDIMEAQKVLGKLLIPLDSDPGTQSGGARFYPLGDLSGSYHYERVVSFQRLFNDLKSEDRDPEDHIRKLAPDEPFILEGRPILVQGILETTDLPDTIASFGRWRPFQTLPIACGIFRKVDKIPGTPDDGIIPGPVADPAEWVDRPAEETEWSDGNGPSTGEGSNDADDGNGPMSDGEGRTSESAPSPIPGNSTSGGSTTTPSSDDEEERPRGRTTTGGSNGGGPETTGSDEGSSEGTSVGSGDVDITGSTSSSSTTGGTFF
jgi:hypothetical protein